MPFAARIAKPPLLAALAGGIPLLIQLARKLLSLDLVPDLLAVLTALRVSLPRETCSDLRKHAGCVESRNLARFHAERRKAQTPSS
jgi:LPS sulfotransferase NodH